MVLTEINEIKNVSIELMKKIPPEGTIKILIEKRHTDLNRNIIIDEIGPFIPCKVNLTSPDWILLIEIIGKFSGISVIKSANLFSSAIEKRVDN